MKKKFIIFLISSIGLYLNAFEPNYSIWSVGSIAKIKNPDVLMIPIGGRDLDNTMDEHETLEAIKIIQPRMVIPMHFDLPILFTKHYAAIDEILFTNEIEKMGIQSVILKKGQSLKTI